VSNRLFGVEIECYAPEGEEGWDGENGVEYTASVLEEQGYPSWARLTDADSSLYHGFGVEVKSPPLAGSNGYNEVTSILNILNDHDYWIDSSCGLHVHLNAPEFVDDPKLIKRTVKAWMRNQHLINNMVAEYRINNSHCEPWDDAYLADLEEVLAEYNTAEETHRGAINVGSLTIHETIEIRQHEGTLVPEAVVSWIKFCQAFIDAIPGTTIQKISDEELFLRRLKVERNASRFLTTKARVAKRRKAESGR